MIAACDDHSRAGVPQPEQCLVVQRDSSHRRHRPVVDVTGDQHGVDALCPHDLDQRLQERLLRGAEVGPVQRPAEVPVGGVEQSHSRTVGAPSDRTERDTSTPHRPCGGGGRMSRSRGTPGPPTRKDRPVDPRTAPDDTHRSAFADELRVRVAEAQTSLAAAEVLDEPLTAQIAAADLADLQVLADRNDVDL